MPPTNISTDSEIPEFVVSPGHAQIFMFSAVTWNRHHIHYDKDAAVAEGLPDIVVQRSLIGNYFVRTLTNWLDRADCIKKLEWRMNSSALPGEALTFRGRVTDITGNVSSQKILCEIEASSEDNRIIARAKAEIRLPL